MKAKDIQKLSKQDREKKLGELRLELVKAQAGSQKTTSKKKEIKRIIARIHTFNKSDEKSKEELKKK